MLLQTEASLSTVHLQILMYLARTVDNDILRSLLLAANCAHLVQYMGWVDLAGATSARGHVSC
jgi:hypothetical protein